MKTKKVFALLLAAAMGLSLVGCGGGDSTEDGGGGEASQMTLGYDPATGEELFGPVYDDWSDKTDEELYEMAKEEGGTIRRRARSPSVPAGACRARRRTRRPGWRARGLPVRRPWSCRPHLRHSPPKARYGS